MPSRGPSAASGRGGWDLVAGLVGKDRVVRSG